MKDGARRAADGVISCAIAAGVVCLTLLVLAMIAISFVKL
jgi:hypothetical protein